MATRAQSTIEDLYHLPDNARAELVNGEIVLMSPTGKLPNYAAGEIFVSLHRYAKRSGLGHAATDNLGFTVNLLGWSMPVDDIFPEGKSEPL